MSEKSLLTPYPRDIVFFIKDDKEILRLCENGDILVKKEKIVNDIEVYNALKIFLQI